ncbi:MAG TPA: dockerin type I domain-containing protein [Phycisphaerae bacterium]|nr:dockerin type I domain-containing protein [Phycisphaerae bacterium]
MLRLPAFLAVCAIVSILLPAGPASAANTAEGLTAYADPAEINIGYRWMIDGDENLNASCSVRVRKQGDATWSDALDAWRFHPWVSPSEDGWNNSNSAYKAENRFAGSVFWVEPGQTYEIELTLTDPDGVVGTNPVVLVTTTWQEMAPSATGRKLYVVPGSGGGTGSPDDPFQGLSAAHAAAQPGDIFYLGSGTYPPFVLTTSGTATQPICWIGPPDRSAVIDGGGAFAALQLGDNSTLRGHWIVERLTLRNADYACDAQRVQHVKFRHNVFENIQNGYVNRRSYGDEFRQAVMDNEVVGDEPWVASTIGGTEGIQIHGTSAIVAHNIVQRFADGVSIDPTYSTTSSPYGANNNCYDTFGNHVTRCGDDGLEVDHVVANARTWRNAVTNCRMGVSNQPLFGGPAYAFRNEIFYLQDAGPGVATGSAYKLHNGASGTVLIHNTSSKDAEAFITCMFQNSFLRSNIIMGSTRGLIMFSCGTDDGLPPDYSVNDWDHNAYRAGAGQVVVEWFNLANYYSVASLAAAQGVETHGMDATYADLVDAIPPAVFEEPGVELADFDLSLAAGAPEIDAGAVLPNINDPFVDDGLPDIGFLEYGRPRPQYGPRPVGDANRDFTIDAADLSDVRNALGEPAQDHPPLDVFIDGSLDVKDLLFARNRSLDTTGGSGASGSASVHVELFAPGGGKTLQISPNQPFQLEVRANISGQSLAAAAYTLQADTSATLTGRSLTSPLTYVGSAPGQEDLPAALGSFREVAFDADPNGGDGIAVGTNVLIEELTFAGQPSGTVVISLGDPDAAYTSSQFPDGRTFEAITAGAPVTVQFTGLPTLASSEPGADGTLPKTQNNVILLTFSSAIALPGGGAAALQIVPLAGGSDLGANFTYSVEPDGVTLKAVEQGAVLTDQTWYGVSPATAFAVAPFVLDLCTLRGDADNSGRVTTADYAAVKGQMGQYTDGRSDLNGNGRVTTADYSVVKAHMGSRTPVKP